jgi:hypothetical protein
MCLCYKKHETFRQLISVVLPIHYEIKQLCHHFCSCFGLLSSHMCQNRDAVVKVGG